MRFLAGLHQTARAHPGLILLLGGFTGWLWSFPIYGPVLAAAGACRGLADTGAVSTAFLVLHVIGLAAAGYLLARRGADRLLFAAAALACGLLTAAFALAAPVRWPCLGGLLGVAAAPFVVAWGRRLAMEVARAERGQVMALSLAAGVLLNAVQIGAAARAPAPTALILSALLIFLSAFAALRFGQRFPAGPGESRPLPRSGASLSFLPSLGAWWRFGVLIFLFYLVGGLMCQVMQPVIGQHVPSTPYLATFSYGAAGLVAGPLADRRGRCFLPPAGVGLVGSSFALFAFWPGLPGYVIAQILIQAGYACLDLFIFLFLADWAGGNPARAARCYGWGLGLNVFAVLAGTLTGSLLQSIWLAERPVKASLLASLALFVAIPFLAGMRESPAGAGGRPESVPGGSFGRIPAAAPETAASVDPAAGRTPDAAASPAEALDRLRPCLLEEGFTPREIEIALLILEGLDNTAIALRLNITKNTLKTHMRNILKKAKATGKVSFILWVQEATKNHLFR